MIPRDPSLIFARPPVYIRKKNNVLTKPLFGSLGILSLVIMGGALQGETTSTLSLGSQNP
jgi:hypothetical protein